VSSIHKAIKIRFDRGGRALYNSLAQQCTPLRIHDDSNRSRSLYSLENNNNNNNNTIAGGTELCKSAELGPRGYTGAALLHSRRVGGNDTK